MLRTGKFMGWMEMKSRNYRIAHTHPYVRKKYIHGAPPPKIGKFTMGNSKTNYDYKLSLAAKNRIQIRHNALEAMRIAANKILVDNVGESEYRLQVCIYPHVVLRENKMIATAGADRLQEGMRRAFGKPTGRAAVVGAGQPILNVYVKSQGLEHAKEALRVGATKLPTPCNVLIERTSELIVSSGL